MQGGHGQQQEKRETKVHQGCDYFFNKKHEKILLMHMNVVNIY
ncbi:Uncharacterised protein [Janthinobacterium lividum]|nr:hypothetical protein JANLI_39380 [Janthinobacterium lividum]STS86052.1 Uncharacterised protein [Janthinobacterium lividum]